MKRSLYAFTFAFAASIASAQYNVVASSRGWSEADYNWAAHTGGYTHLATFGSPSALAPSDLTGTLTSASTEVSGGGPGYPHNPNTFDNVRSSANLASASMSMMEYDTATDGAYTGDDGGDTHSELHDHLTFTIAGANASTITNLAYTYTLSGYMRQSGSYFGGNAHDLYSDWHFGGASGQTSIQLDVSSGYVAYVNGYNGSGTFTNHTPDLIVQTGIIVITGTSYSADLGMTLSSHLANGMDVGYTNSIKFEAQPNVTMTSSSGVFGTQAVPEPGAIVTLLVGGAALLRRRK